MLNLDVISLFRVFLKVFRLKGLSYFIERYFGGEKFFHFEGILIADQPVFDFSRGLIFAD